MHTRRRYKPRGPVRAFHGQTNYEKRMEAWLMGYIQHEKQMMSDETPDGYLSDGSRDPYS